MKVSRFTFNPFGENTYILWDPKSNDAIIVDPGMSNDGEIKIIDDFIDERHLNVIRLLFTHLHLDHAWGAQHIMNKYNVEPETSVQELVLGNKLQQQSKMFGMPTEIPPIDKVKGLKEGDVISLGDEDINVIQISGHTPGHLLYYVPVSNVLISGDVLFEGSIGRTDLEGGNYENLVNGIREKLMNLPDATLVCPGHGGTTTIGDERSNNPFIR